MNSRPIQLILSLIMAICLNATAQVTAVIKPESTALYVNQVFDFDLIVSASGVTLAKEMNLSNMPDQGILRFEKFDELPPEQKVVNGVESETRRFRCRARAMRPGAVQLSPGLEVG